MAQTIDPNKLDFQWRTYVSSPDNQKNTYSLRMGYDGKSYDFIPESVINTGVNNGDNTSFFTYFLNKDNLNNFFKNATPVDLGNVSWYGDYLTNKVGASTKGYLVPAGFDIGSPNIVSNDSTGGGLTGIGQKGDELVYGTKLSGDTSGYLDSSGNFTKTNINRGGGGLFGGFLGDIVNPVIGAASDLLSSPIGQIASLYFGGSALLDALGGASTVGGVLGPDNIDVGGGFNIATPPSVTPLPSIGSLPNFGPPVQVADASGALPNLPPPYTGQGLQAPPLGTTVAPTTTNLADMGGGQGLGGGTTLSNLADMGGAQGLTLGTGLGATLGQSGVGGALTPSVLSGGLGYGLANTTSDLANATTAAGLGSALGGGGTSLSDILPYTTAAGALGGYLQSDAAVKAAQIQADAANKALAQQQANFELINKQQAPYRASGYGALNQIGALGGGPYVQYDASGQPIGTGTGTGYLTKQFSPEDFAKGIDPGYAFRLQQGQMANLRQANVGGGALSGNTLRGLQDYTQGLASQEYGNAFNRFQQQRTNIYNTLASIAGIGQTGQTATNLASTNLANAASALGVGAAGAQAAGQVGSTNAYTNAINNAIQNYTLASLLNQRGTLA